MKLNLNRKHIIENLGCVYSTRSAPGRCKQNKVATVDIIIFLSFFSGLTFSLRRGSHRVLKFCMVANLTNISTQVDAGLSDRVNYVQTREVRNPFGGIKNYSKSILTNWIFVSLCHIHNFSII